MKENIYVSAVIYVNKTKNLKNFLVGTCNFFEEHFYEYEMVIVSDGQSSAVYEILDQLNDELRSHFVIVDLKFKHGMERALQAGADICIGDYIFEFSDIDQCCSDQTLYSIYRSALQGNYDIVFYTNSRDTLINKILNKRLQNLDLREAKIILASRRALNSISKKKYKVRDRALMYINSGFNYTYVYEHGKSSIFSSLRKLKYYLINSSLLGKFIGYGALFYTILDLFAIIKYCTTRNNSYDTGLKLLILGGINLLVFIAYLILKYVINTYLQTIDTELYTSRNVGRLKK